METQQTARGETSLTCHVCGRQETGHARHYHVCPSCGRCDHTCPHIVCDEASLTQLLCAECAAQAPIPEGFYPFGLGSVTVLGWDHVQETRDSERGPVVTDYRASVGSLPGVVQVHGGIAGSSYWQTGATGEAWDGMTRYPGDPTPYRCRAMYSTGPRETGRYMPSPAEVREAIRRRLSNLPNSPVCP